MQFINKHMKGRQEVGNIDLLSKMSYIEVPEEDAEKVMDALDGTTYKGRDVRCNDATRAAKAAAESAESLRTEASRDLRRSRSAVQERLKKAPRRRKRPRHRRPTAA